MGIDSVYIFSFTLSQSVRDSLRQVCDENICLPSTVF